MYRIHKKVNVIKIHLHYTVIKQNAYLLSTYLVPCIIYRFGIVLHTVIRKTWKGMNQTKMEGGTERHLPKTDDRHRRVSW